ncbi:WD repeat-containing protein 76 [Tanacetum coccineum]
MKDANTCFKSDQILISQLKNIDVHARVKASIDLDSMMLAPKNIANALPYLIRSIKFFPSTDMRMVVVGNQLGTIGFWNVDSKKEDGDGIYTYHTNLGLVSAILIQPFSANKVHVSENNRVGNAMKDAGFWTVFSKQNKGTRSSNVRYGEREMEDGAPERGLVVRNGWILFLPQSIKRARDTTHLGLVHPTEQSLGNIGDAEEDEVQELRRPMAMAGTKRKVEMALHDKLATEMKKEERLTYLEIKRREVECREQELAMHEYRERQEDKVLGM